MSNCTRLTNSSFSDEVLGVSDPVLVEFWGSWCPPCKMMEPVLETLAERLAGRIKICKLNIDQFPAFRSTYQIMGVPTFIVFDGGNPVGRAIGAHSLQQLLGLIDAALAQRAAVRPIVEIPAASPRDRGRTVVTNETHS
jgi:thioredoxin 1